MAYINVAEWTSENVAEWLGGLEDAILPYAHFFINNQIDGRHLLTLLPDDLKNLNIIKIGHQEIILDAVDLLRQLHYTLTTETLQSIALRVGCKARSLFNELKRNGPKDCPENKGAKQERVSCNILASVSDILIAVKAFISWLDRYPFDGEAKYIPVRKSLLTFSIELASTAQRDQFAEKPHDIIKTSALNLAELCDQVIQEFNDSLIIQPASLDIITIKRKPKEEWGIHIHSTYNGVHIVGGIKHQSPSHRCAKVEIGDEIIQVNYQTVVGWQLKKLVYAMSEHATDVHLTLKKRPRHSNLAGQVIIMKPYRIPCRKTALARLHKWSDSNCSLHIQEGGYVSSTNKAPIATDEIEDDDAFLPDKSSISVSVPPTKVLNHTNGNSVEKVVPFQPKSRATVQRRATVSGASPIMIRSPISIEELVNGVGSKTTSPQHKELVGRSFSHDLTMNQPSLSFLKHLSSLQAADERDELTQPHVDRVNPNEFPVKSPLRNVRPSPTHLSQAGILDGSNSGGSDGDSGIADEKGSIYGSTFPHWKLAKPKPEAKDLKLSQAFEEDNVLESKLLAQTHGEGAQRHLKKLMEQIVSPSSTPPPSSPVRKQNSSSSIASSTISDNVFLQSNSEISEKSKLLEEEQSKSSSSIEKKYIFQSPMLRKKHRFHGRFASRRISCKDLGQGDCQGFLFKRKDGKRLFSGPKWIKKWVVLKKQYLYCYQDKDDVRAECLVFLPGFAVSPASDCKAKKYAFKLHSPSASFLFASENVSDMTKWMNKMGLAAISYPSINSLAGETEEVYFSETEDEADDVSPCRSISGGSTVDSYNTPISESKSKSAMSPKIPMNSSGVLKTVSSSSVDKFDCGRAGSLSPKSPSSFAGKISFPKPNNCVVGVSPRKTVAEKPLEKCYPEQESYRRSSSSTRSTVYPNKLGSSNRHSGNWTPPEQVDHNSPPSYHQRSVGHFRSSGDIGISSPLGYNSSTSSGSDVNQQSLRRNSQSIKASQFPTTSNRAPALPSRSKPQALPTQSVSSTYSNQQSPMSSWKGSSRSNPSVSSMLRCSSLQKLNASETWPVETKDLPEANQAQSLQRQKEFVSVLDREYRRLYGDKKPETISPKHLADDENHHTSLDGSGRSSNTWWGNVNVVRSATSQQIHSLYTRDCSNLPVEEKARSISVSSESAATPNLESGTISNAPALPQRNSSAKFYLSGVNSIGRATKKSNDDRQISAPYPSTTSPVSSYSTPSTPVNKNLSDISSKGAKFSLTKQFSPKSPGTSSSSFRFFSSPKFVRKFTSPKPERKQVTSTATVTSPTIALGHLNGANSVTEVKISPNVSENCSSLSIASGRPTSVSGSSAKPQKPERTFLGSPKLARAIFGSPKLTRKPVPSRTTAVQTEHTFDELVRLHQQSMSNGNQSASSTNSPKSSTHVVGGSSVGKRTESESSLNSNASGSALSSTGSAHYYVETRIRPQITISLPLVTESGRVSDGRFMSRVSEEDQNESADPPDTPKTPGSLSKPTMGVSMLSKKRSPSASSEIALQSDGRTSRQTTTDGNDAENGDSESTLVDLSFEEQEEFDQRTKRVEEEIKRSQRSEITVVIRGETPGSEDVESVTMTTREKDELEALMESFKELGLSPDGINIEERRRRLLSLLSKHDNDMDQNDRITRLVLDFRALQRTLKDHEVEAAAIDQLLAEPITSQALENWICQYPHLLPPDYC